MGSRVELFAQIRRDERVEGLGIRALARKYRVGRDTVRTALSRADPPPRKAPVRASPTLGPFKDPIDAMLREDLDAPRKQRHTATRILARLADEHGATDLSYSTVRDYVRLRRAQIDPRLCAAIVDRLTFNGTIIQTGTDSYRLNHTRMHS